MWTLEVLLLLVLIWQTSGTRIQLGRWQWKIVVDWIQNITFQKRWHPKELKMIAEKRSHVENTGEWVNAVCCTLLTDPSQSESYCCSPLNKIVEP